MMSRSESNYYTRTVLESRRAASTTRRKIGSGVPEGLEGAIKRPHCGAVAGISQHAPMT
jgi:hypothetical protein